MTVKEPNWHAKHNGDMLKAEAWLQKEWAALPLGWKVAVFLLAVLGVVVGAEWRNRYRIDAWYHAHHSQVILAAVLVALAAAFPLFLLARHRWRHWTVERHLSAIKKHEENQKRMKKALGFEPSTKTTRLLERERMKLAERLNQTPPPKAEEAEEQLARLPDVIPWERPQVHSCMDPVVVGGYADDVPMRICLTPAPGQQLNMLIAGMSGYGKTTLVNALIANYAYCKDAVMAGIDVMGGGFHRWRRLFLDGWYADKDDDVEPVLARIKDEIDRRSRHLQVKQDRDEEPIWDPLVDGPDVFLFVDEGADLVGIPDAYDILFEVARKGRKYGVHVIFATQRPSADVIPTTLRSQLQVRVSLRVMVSTDAEVIFGPGSVSAGWRPHQIPRDGRGIAVLEVPTSDVTQEPGRTIRMLPDQVRLVVEDRAGQQPPLRSKPPIPPPSEAPAIDYTPPQGLAGDALKAWCRKVTWDGIAHGDIRGRPEYCEREGCDHKLIQGPKGHYPHHWDYTDPKLISWLCRPHHDEADMERETGGEWTKAKLFEVCEQVHTTDLTWRQAAARYGMTYDALRLRCRRAYGDHPVFKKRPKRTTKAT